ncbi:Zf-FLZ domain [Dillenia turbinata]|uniref:Zf-FLZ domain n=1 Tax=Dillenia turbinata TaxID=194707 RepID=A0AAN8VHB5_9MAGN
MSRYGEISVGALTKPSFAPTLQQKKKPCPITVQKPKPVERPVFTPGSPVSSIARSDHQGIANADGGLFLQSCFQCKKQFGENDDLFMYG